jgi:hypothetical protein
MLWGGMIMGYLAMIVYGTNNSIVILGFYGMWGLILILVGVGSATSMARNRHNRTYIHRQLSEYGAIDDQVTIDAPIVSDVMQEIGWLRAFGFLCAGLAFVVWGILWYIIALITDGRPIDTDIDTGGMLDILIAMLAFCSGHALRVAQLRSRNRSRTTYADVRRRSIRDYRSPVLGWLVILLGIGGGAAALWIGTHSSGSIYYSSPGWIIQTIINITSLTVCGELMVRWLSALPRILLIADPVRAQRADDIVRAMTIGTIQALVLLLLFGFVSPLWDILVSLYHLPSLAIEISLKGATWRLGLGILAFALFFFGGRLGGRITGWPWHHPTLQPVVQAN